MNMYMLKRKLKNLFNNEPFPPGEILKKQMEELKMTPEVFSNLTGFSTKKVLKIIKGKASLSYDEAYTLELFSDVFYLDWKPDRRD